MNFLWTEEQNTLYQKTLQFVEQALTATNDPSQPWTHEQWRQCGAFGLLGLSVPRNYQGGGYDALTTAHVLEAFGKAYKDMGLLFSAAAHLFACCMPISEFGSDELKNRLLPKLCSGELVGANAITEEGAGSDVFALKTQAIHSEDTYILTGTKSYVSNGPVADVFIIYAITNPAHGYLGISSFAVEKNTKGLSTSEPFEKMGLSGTLACQLHLDACSVPVANRLGNEGQGASIFKRSMQWERVCLFASYVGQMERQLNLVIQHAQKRRQFGKPIGKHQVIAHQIADMKLRLETARLLLYRACWLFDRGEASALDISLSKLAISEAAIKGGLDAIHIYGAAGFNKEYGIEQMLRDAIPSTIFSGTSEMQRDIIANELGL